MTDKREPYVICGTIIFVAWMCVISALGSDILRELEGIRKAVENKEVQGE